MTCVILALSGAGCSLFAQNPLTLQISNQTAPTGSVVQIKVFSAAPASIASGSIAIDLDPAVFGEISGIAVFSANGDAMGYANVRGQHADAHFSSASNGIGLLPGLPVFTISVPILANAAPGMTASVILDPSGSTWRDAQSNPYSVTVSPAQFSVGGSLSVENVTPGGGVLPAGAILRIRGTGFDASTSASIDGVSVFDVQFVSPEVLQVILGAPTEMTGKHVQVVDSSGSQADYFCSLPSAPSNSDVPFAGVHLIVPLRAFTGDLPPNDSHAPRMDAVALLNQNWTPVTVRFFAAGQVGLNFYATLLDYTVTIPPSTLYFLDSPQHIGTHIGLSITASAPIRMLEYQYGPAYSYGGTNGEGTVAAQVYVYPPNPPAPMILVTQHGVSWNWPTGSPAPSPASIYVYQGSADFTVSVTGAPWLSVSPTQRSVPATLTLTPNVSGLSEGTYNGMVTITPAIPGGSLIAVTINVTLTVGPPVGMARTVTQPRLATDQPISVSPSSISWNWSPGMPAPTASVSVGGTGFFQVGVSDSWLTVTPTGLAVVTSPATLTLTANISALYPGSYTGTVWIATLPNQSPVALPVQVTLTVTTPAPSGPSTLIVTPPSVSLVSPALPELLNIDSPNPFTLFGVSISDAKQFLSFSIPNQNASFPKFYTPATLTVRAVSNQPGTYGGAIVLTTSDGSVSVPVTLYETAWPGISPVMSMIVNAESRLPGAISSGETVAIYGSGIGSAPIGLTLNATGKTATDLGGTEVLINGVAAPLVYASEGQVNAIVPDEVGMVGTATVQVNWKGLTTEVWGVPLAKRPER